MPEYSPTKSLDFGEEGGPFLAVQWDKALVRGQNLENVSIVGPGTIDGGGFRDASPLHRARTAT